MVLEQLLTGSRWEILEQLAEAPKSTGELAKKLGTSAANISQQLKQLELGGIIKKERTKKTNKHYEYHINKTRLLITHLAERTAQKKEYGEKPLETFIASLLLHPQAIPLLTLILSRPELTKRFLAIGVLRRKEPEIFILAEHVEDIRREHANITMETLLGTRKVAVWSHTPQEVKEGLARKEHYYETMLKEIEVMYDPQGDLLELKKMREAT